MAGGIPTCGFVRGFWSMVFGCRFVMVDLCEWWCIYIYIGGICFLLQVCYCWFKGKMWVLLGEYPIAVVPKILPHICPIQPLYKPYMWYMLVCISGTPPRVPNFSLWLICWMMMYIYIYMGGDRWWQISPFSSIFPFFWGDRRQQCKGLNSIFRTKSVMNPTGVKVNHQLSED